MRHEMNVQNFFRINDWWKSKAALLMGMVYLYTAWFAISFDSMMGLSFFSLITISGFASIGYLCNDFFDREKDLLAQKRNFLLHKSPFFVSLCFFTAFLFMFLPWLYLPFDRISILFFAIELILFFLYSVKPFRFKERGILGIVTDALYAHTLPVILSLYTFALASAKQPPLFSIAILLLWQTTNGIRNILLHQHEDAVKDKQSGSENFVSTVSAINFFASIKVLILTEILLSSLFFVCLTEQNPLFIYCVILIWFFAVLIFVVFYNPGFSVFLQTRWKYFPNPVFEKWLSVVILLGLSCIDKRFVFVLLLHITIFNIGLYTEIFNHLIVPVKDLMKYVLFQLIISTRRFFSFIINYTIYYLFLFFDVDLKKENSSAINYLKNLRNGK